MIHSIPNPKMTVREVEAFREDVLRQALGNASEQEKKEIADRIERMNRVAKKVIANNGGKNPILGY